MWLHHVLINLIVCYAVLVGGSCVLAVFICAFAGLVVVIRRTSLAFYDLWQWQPSGLPFWRSEEAHDEKVQ